MKHINTRLGGLLSALLLLSLVGGCGTHPDLEPSPFREVNTLEGVWVEMDPDTLTPGGGEMVIHNTTERVDLVYGLGFYPEFERDGGWYVYPPLPDALIGAPSLELHIPAASDIQAGFVDGVHYDSGSALTWKRYPPDRMGYYWEQRYGELPPGGYRLVIEVLSERDYPITEDSPRYYLTAPFSIS